MDDFDKIKGMVFPRNVLLGHDILGDVPKVCDEFNFGKKGIMITGNDTYDAAGRAVKNFMEDSGYSITVHHTTSTTIQNVDAATKITSETNADFILAVGGGSKIDISKTVAHELGIPFISIPTSAAHDGIASGRASIKSNFGSKSVNASVPMAVVADTFVISHSSYRLLASGCADVISNLTAIMDWELANDNSEPFSRSAAALSKLAAETIIENSVSIRPNSEESVWFAMRPILMSGISMSVAGNSRPTSGAEHMFSHALDILHPGIALHGEQCGVGSIMTMYLHGGDWQKIRNALKTIGAPTDAKGLGLKPGDIIDALVEAHNIRKDRKTILEGGISREKAEEVARSTKVI